MPKPRIRTLEEFVHYVEARPATLGCWRGGGASQQSSLAWLIHHAVGEVGRLSKETSPEVAMMLLASANHNQVGWASAWILTHMVGPTLRSAVTEPDRLALFNTAGAYWSLRNAITEVRVGARSFSVSGRLVRLAYQSNNEIDALDRFLDLVERLHEAENAPAPPSTNTGRWLAANPAVAWDNLPRRVSDDLRAFAARVLAQLPQYLPERSTVAGISIKTFNAFWIELMARGLQLMLLAWLGNTDAKLIAPRFDEVELVEGIAAQASISPDDVARIVEILSLNTAKCNDPALTPLVRLGSDVVPMSVSIIHTSPHRNLLSIVQRDPSLFGEAGRLLGRAGERETALVLERLRDSCLLATRVKVRRANGDAAGDLDVVVCDPLTRQLAIFEVRWGISSDGNEEVYRTETAAIEKRAQVLKLRKAIESRSAAPVWPGEWPDVGDFTWRWFLLTRDVLPTREVDALGVTIRSVQLLRYTLKNAAGVSELLSALDNPPVPPASLLGTQWSRFRYGDITVEIEQINA